MKKFSNISTATLLLYPLPQKIYNSTKNKRIRSNGPDDICSLWSPQKHGLGTCDHVDHGRGS
ncbi:hypothetical protein CR513_54661, partial [Mucuna pruriens]